MENDPFTEYIERGLQFEASNGFGGMDAIKAREALAWSIYENRPGAGGMLLGDALMGRRHSHSKPELDTVPFAKALLRESFKILNDIECKDSWDWYYLGIAHESGRGTPVDHAKAAECFRNAAELNNPYAEFEEIWSKFLSDKNIIEAIIRFRKCEGKLKYDAKLSGDSLSLLASGPTRNIGSYEHAWRILEIAKLLSRSTGHTSGKRHINIVVEAEMRCDLDKLWGLKSHSAAFVLYVISRRSRKNPTNEEPFHWFKLAATCDSQEFTSMIKHIEMHKDEWNYLSEMSLTEEWQNSELAEYVKKMNEPSEDKYYYE